MKPTIQTRLCVIGAGPTGLAALFQAALKGIPAIGIEAGPSPLAALHGHMEGLVYLSPATHWEIAGLPLDCRDPMQCTREDVLYYYTRLINYAGLQVRCGARCAAIRPVAGGGIVEIQTAHGPQEIHADHVLFTAWYERRRMKPAAIAPDTRVEVLHGISSVAQVAGKRVVVFGGGISGFEYAGALMMAGHRVTLLMRGKRREMHHGPAFTRMLEATRSQVIELASSVRVEREGVSFLASAVRTHVTCDALVYAGGAQLSPSSLGLLVDAGVLSERTAQELSAAPSLEDIQRTAIGWSAAEVERMAVERWPDLWQHLFEGKRNVRLAGGPLHVGASNAGVMVSIASATLAVKAIAGEPPPPALEPPLPRALLRFADIARAAHGDTPRALIESIRPVPVSAWTRGWLHPGVTERASSRTEPLRASERAGTYLLGGDRTKPDTALLELLALCDGTASIGEIADANGLSRPEDRAPLLGAFRRLFARNALTWIPPAYGLAGLAARERAPVAPAPWESARHRSPETAPSLGLP